jgi:heme/copper-type cytochrome/quinol oxidase subunit 4
MTKQFYKDAFGWGFLLWLIGYGLGMVLFSVVPISMIGWVIMPIGTIITLWVLLRKVKADSFKYFALLGLVWVLIAVVFDYFFLVKAFKPADEYYKLDVYLYYALTLALPMIAGWRKKSLIKSA